jgi:hypothetical protein
MAAYRTQVTVTRRSCAPSCRWIPLPVLVGDGAEGWVAVEGGAAQTGAGGNSGEGDRLAVSTAFTGRRVEALRPRIEVIAKELLERWRGWVVDLSCTAFSTS